MIEESSPHLPPTAALPESSGFSWFRTPQSLALRCAALEPLAGNHGFTTKQRALPGQDRDGAGGWTAIARLAGVPPENVVRLTQVHGVDVVDAATAGAARGDALVSDRPDVVLTVRVADCVPILLADPGSGAVAAVHAGWRGTAAGIAARAVQALRARFGVRPDRLVVAVGPSIGPCCYAVGPDVAETFRAAGARADECERWFDSADALRLDLWRTNRDQLVQAGVDPAGVHVARLCTACHPGLFHSYRREGARVGWQVGFIRAPRRP
jgi:polyphenol oxidase